MRIMLRCVVSDYFYFRPISIFPSIFFQHDTFQCYQQSPPLSEAVRGLCAPEGFGLALRTLFARLFGPSLSADSSTILRLILV